MNKFTLPPTPNWQLSNILACNDNGLLAYGSRYEVAIIDVNADKRFNVSFIKLAHQEKVNVVVFSPVEGSFKNCLATCGDDGFVRVWNFLDCKLLYCHSGHKDGVKALGLDWSRADTNRLVSVGDLGTIVCWDLTSNTIRKLQCGIKLLPLCLGCCPHDKDVIALGCKGGVTLVINIKGSGRIVHRLRAHEQDIISLSWCPVPHNVFKHKKPVDSKASGDSKGNEDSEEKHSEDELLLATGGTDKSILIWRAGSDGRYQVQLNLPSSNMANTYQKRRGQAGAGTLMTWTCVQWVDAYTLLSTSQFGELLCWDLNNSYIDDRSGKTKLQPRLIHARHHRGCFSIACPVVYDVVSDWKSGKRVVWTTAMDKHVVACSLASKNTVLDIPTMGGTAYAMAISPLDPNRLAIGSSDSKVFTWNLSDIGSLSITTYWRKIIGKVMALCWHPTEENWLAYGTSDGHVGLIDVGSNKPATVFRLHHRKSVYRVSWAPSLVKSDVESDKLVLYSLGDGDVVQYTADPLEPDEEPKPLNAALLNNVDFSLGLKKPLIRSEVVFKSDLTFFAIGNENGSVYVMSCSTVTLVHVIYPHKKLMNSLEWHPETVASDNSVSLYKDWLATACDNIKVYNILLEGQPELVATLNGHSEKIVGLAWSPHFNGRLVSASYDYSVQVWDVPQQTCIGVYLDHSMFVMSCLFSPLDPDIVISGSSDNTVRLWNISDLNTYPSKPETKKTRMENRLKERRAAQEATELYATTANLSSDDHSTGSSPTKDMCEVASDKGSEDFKKRQKSRNMFIVTSSKLAMAKHFDVLYQRRTTSTTTPTPPNSQPPEPTEENSPFVSELGYLDFFGDEKAMRRLLMVEETQLIKNKHHQLVQNSALWQGDVARMIKEAITKKQLSDWLVSMAPTVGFEVWEEACSAYAEQLVECKEIFKASSYLLATHKVHEAVRLLADYKMFKEAVAVAKCRLCADDPLINQVLVEWGHAVKHQGQLSLAAHCFLAGDDMQTCIETLARVKELKSLKMAATIARDLGNTEMATSLSVECLTMCMMVGNYTVGQDLISEDPQYKHWSVWLKTSELLSKVKNRSEVEVFNWLEGVQPGTFSLFNELTLACTSLGPVYNELLPQLPSNKTPEFERDMWFYVSGHLAAAWAAQAEALIVHFLRHTVSALAAAFHFQTVHVQCLALPLIVSVLAPKGLFAEGSILTTEYETTEQKQLVKSLKAFVCASVIHWMNNNWEKVENILLKSEEIPVENSDGNGVTKQEEYKMCWLLELLKNCCAEVLDTENVSFFVKTAQKKKLQSVINQENILKKCVEMKVESNNKSKRKRSKQKDLSAVESTVEKDVTLIAQDSEKTHVITSDVNVNIAETKNSVTISSNNSELRENTQQKTEKLGASNLIQEESQTVKPLNTDISAANSTSIETCINNSDIVTLNANTNGTVDSSENVQKADCKPKTAVTNRKKENSTSKPSENSKTNGGLGTLFIQKVEDTITCVKSNPAASVVNSNPSEPPQTTASRDVVINSTGNSDVSEKEIMTKTTKKTVDSSENLPKADCKPKTALTDGIKENSTNKAPVNTNTNGGIKNPVVQKVEDTTTSVKSIAAALDKDSDLSDKSPQTTKSEEVVIKSTGNSDVSEKQIKSKEEEIKELDEALQKFESERVSAPSPFTAYMNIKYLIDNVVSKHDCNLAQSLQLKCDEIWKQSHQ